MTVEDDGPRASSPSMKQHPAVAVAAAAAAAKKATWDAHGQGASQEWHPMVMNSWMPEQEPPPGVHYGAAFHDGMSTDFGCYSSAGSLQSLPRPSSTNSLQDSRRPVSTRNLGTSMARLPNACSGHPDEIQHVAEVAFEKSRFEPDLRIQKLHGHPAPIHVYLDKNTKPLPERMVGVLHSLPVGFCSTGVTFLVPQV